MPALALAGCDSEDGNPAAPMGDLKNILLYRTVPTDVKGGKIILNGNVEVTVTDIAAANGTIRAIHGAPGRNLRENQA